MSYQAKERLAEGAALGGLGGFMVVLLLMGVQAPASLFVSVGICALGAVVGVALEVPWLVRRARRLREAARADRGGHVGPVRSGGRAA